MDEIGYLSYDNRNADLLFQVVRRCHEKRSVVLTADLAFSDWPAVFPNAARTTALIDRLVHHSEIITIEGKSYRAREAEEAKPARRSPSLRRIARRLTSGSTRPCPRSAPPGGHGGVTC